MQGTVPMSGHLASRSGLSVVAIHQNDLLGLGTGIELHWLRP